MCSLPQVNSGIISNEKVNEHDPRGFCPGNVSIRGSAQGRVIENIFTAKYARPKHTGVSISSLRVIRSSSHTSVGKFRSVSWI